MSASDSQPLIPSQPMRNLEPKSSPNVPPPRVIVKKPTLVQTFQDETTSSLKFGFTIATALAWNEAFRSLITKFIVSKDVPYYNTVYALVLTFISILFMILMKRMKKVSTTKIE